MNQTEILKDIGHDLHITGRSVIMEENELDTPNLTVNRAARNQESVMHKSAGHSSNQKDNKNDMQETAMSFGNKSQKKEIRVDQVDQTSPSFVEEADDSQNEVKSEQTEVERVSARHDKTQERNVMYAKQD